MSPAEVRSERLAILRARTARLPFRHLRRPGRLGRRAGLAQAIEGARHGGVGPGVSPKLALALGLKVDARAIPKKVARAIKAGKVNLNDPAVTLKLLKLNAVVGVNRRSRFAGI